MGSGRWKRRSRDVMLGLSRADVLRSLQSRIGRAVENLAKASY